MKKEKNFLAFDLGAGSGRAALGIFDGKRLSLFECSRFNHQIQGHGSQLSWDIDGIYAHILSCFGELHKRHIELASFGLDAWGVDFGLLDRNHKPLLHPRSYRRMNPEDRDPVHSLIPFQELFARTGLADNPLNTIYQLARLEREEPELLDQAGHFLMVPAYIMNLLTGEVSNELTSVSTSMLCSPFTGTWDLKLLSSLKIRSEIFGEILPSGTFAGKLRAKIGSEVGYPELKYVAVGTLDTSSAVSVSLAGPSGAHISSGTWSLLGTETREAILTDYARTHFFSSERNVQGTFRPVKNLCGMWILQQCIRAWGKLGKHYSYAELTEGAQNEVPWRSLIDVDDTRFQGICDMPSTICSYCNEKGQPVPETPEQIARCFFDSLALKYRHSFFELQELMQRPLTQLHIFGGGSKNGFLNQLTANALQVPVLAGPAEASSIGNILMQLVAAGELQNLSEGRDLVAHSFQVQTYLPQKRTGLDEAYARFIALLPQNH